MPYADKTKLTAKDACDIIGVCRRWGVAELKFKDLSISFAKMGEIQADAFTTPTLVDQPEKIADDKSFLEAREKQIKEEELANMAIEDPLKYEETLLGDDLIDLGEQDAEA